VPKSSLAARIGRRLLRPRLLRATDRPHWRPATLRRLVPVRWLVPRPRPTALRAPEPGYFARDTVWAAFQPGLPAVPDSWQAGAPVMPVSEVPGPPPTLPATSPAPPPPRRASPAAPARPAAPRRPAEAGRGATIVEKGIQRIGAPPEQMPPPAAPPAESPRAPSEQPPAQSIEPNARPAEATAAPSRAAAEPPAVREADAHAVLRAPEMAPSARPPAPPPQPSRQATPPPGPQRPAPLPLAARRPPTLSRTPLGRAHPSVALGGTRKVAPPPPGRPLAAPPELPPVARQVRASTAETAPLPQSSIATPEPGTPSTAPVRRRELVGSGEPAGPAPAPEYRPTAQPRDVAGTGEAPLTSRPQEGASATRPAPSGGTPPAAPPEARVSGPPTRPERTAAQPASLRAALPLLRPVTPRSAPGAVRRIASGALEEPSPLPQTVPSTPAAPRPEPPTPMGPPELRHPSAPPAGPLPLAAQGLARSASAGAPAGPLQVPAAAPPDELPLARPAATTGLPLAGPTAPRRGAVMAAPGPVQAAATGWAPAGVQPAVQRQAAEEGGEAPPPRAGEVAAPQPTPPEAGTALAPDLETLARQVYEILRRRLHVERERACGRSA